MSAPNYTWPTLAPPRITYAKFKSLLVEKNSPAVPEAQTIWDVFISQGVDPSFALAQYRVESQMGTVGYAKITKSWGNMLYDKSLCLNAAGKYSPGNGYIYAKYNNITDAAKDYAHYLHDYTENRGLPDIYRATAEWIGKAPGSSGHLSYVSIIINDMTSYEYKSNEYFEVGDWMIYAQSSFDTTTGKLNRKYPVTRNMPLYKGTDGTLLKYFDGPSSDPANIASFAWYLGPVQGDVKWAAILIRTSWADPSGTWCYIKNIDVTKIKKV